MTARTRLWVGLAVVLCLWGNPGAGLTRAQTQAKKAEPPGQLTPPPVFNKAAPENVADLRAMEQHVQKVLDKVMPAVVGIRVGAGQGSGVIISADGLVLTAGHVSGTPKRKAVVVMPNGQQLKARALGQNKTIDSGMVKIISPGKYPFLEMGKSANLRKGQWVLAIGHPGGFRSNRTPVVRLGRILFANAFVIQTDCTLVGGDSGGPLFDMQGRVIGIHSRIGGLSIAQNMHVPIETYRQTFDRLARGESWGLGLGKVMVVRSAGGNSIFEKKDTLTRSDRAGPSPKDRDEQGYRKIYTVAMKAGRTYTIDLNGTDKTGKEYDPYLRLESPDGKPLAEDDDSGGFPHARVVYKPLKDGDYRVIATSFEPKQTGAFTVKVLEAHFRDALVSGKVDVVRSLRIPIPALTKLIDQFNKVKVPLHLNVLLLDDKGNPWPDQSVTLKSAKSTASHKSQHDGHVRWKLQIGPDRQLQLQLPKGAQAWVGLSDPDGQAVPIFTADPSIEKVKNAGGSIVKTIEGTLKKSDPFDFGREQCYRQIHEIPMKADRTYTIDLVSEHFDAYLRLEDDGRDPLAEDDDGAGFLNARIVFTPVRDGVHRLIVTTCDPGQFGTYRLIVRETTAPAGSTAAANK